MFRLRPRVQVVRNRLRRNVQASPIGDTPASEPVAGVRAVSRWWPMLAELPRPLLSVAVAVFSLWVVLLCGGVFAGADDDSHTLAIAVTDSVKYPEHIQEFSKFLSEYKLRAEVSLQSELITHAPRYLQRLTPSTAYETEAQSFLRSGAGAAVLLVRTISIDAKPTDEDAAKILRVKSVPLEVDSSRALLETVPTQADGSGATVRYTLIEVHQSAFPVDRHPYRYWVDCPLSVIDRGGAPWHVTYVCPLRFKNRLDASKGLAQLIWRQSVQASFDSHAVTGNQSIVFDAAFEDARGIPIDIGVDKTAVDVHWDDSNDYSAPTGRVEQESPADRGGFTADLGLLLQGTNPARKDLSDFILFGVAALFGAAAASLFEQASSLLKRRKD